MRCSCPNCTDVYMIQSETGIIACCCPECGYRCNACMGTGTVISREALLEMKDTQWMEYRFEDADDAETDTY